MYPVRMPSSIRTVLDVVFLVVDRQRAAAVGDGAVIDNSDAGRDAFAQSGERAGFAIEITF